MDLSISTGSVKDAQAALKTLRAGRAGRTSRYQAIVEAAQASKPGHVVTVEGVGKAQVQPLRSYVLGHLDRDDWRVKSAADRDAETYTVVVGRAVDFE